MTRRGLLIEIDPDTGCQHIAALLPASFPARPRTVPRWVYLVGGLVLWALAIAVVTWR